MPSRRVNDFLRVTRVLVAYALVWIPLVPAMSAIVFASTARASPYCNSLVRNCSSDGESASQNRSTASDKMGDHIELIVDAGHAVHRRGFHAELSNDGRVVGAD